jgi:hypothetical protein
MIDGSLSVQDSKFDNTAQGDGGSFYLKDTALAFGNSTVDGNAYDGDGGGFLLDGDGTGVLPHGATVGFSMDFGTSIRACSASRDGGAIALLNGTLTMLACKLTDTQLAGRNGGVISATGGTVTSAMF